MSMFRSDRYGKYQIFEGLFSKYRPSKQPDSYFPHMGKRVYYKQNSHGRYDFYSHVYPNFCHYDKEWDQGVRDSITTIEFVKTMMRRYRAQSDKLFLAKSPK